MTIKRPTTPFANRFHCHFFSFNLRHPFDTTSYYKDAYYTPKNPTAFSYVYSCRSTYIMHTCYAYILIDERVLPLESTSRALVQAEPRPALPTHPGSQ